MSYSFTQITPILRIFDVPKADEFYLQYLGFRTDWDHRFDDTAPLYRQISKGSLVLHLSEHHGDGTPGTKLRVRLTHLNALHEELKGKQYRYMRPGITDGIAAGSREMTVMDPFGNEITFHEDPTSSEEY